MPRTLGEVPPDHPLFTIGPSFVLKNQLDATADEEDNGSSKDAQRSEAEDE